MTTRNPLQDICSACGYERAKHIAIRPGEGIPIGGRCPVPSLDYNYSERYNPDGSVSFMLTSEAATQGSQAVPQYSATCSPHHEGRAQHDH